MDARAVLVQASLNPQTGMVDDIEEAGTDRRNTRCHAVVFASPTGTGSSMFVRYCSRRGIEHPKVTTFVEHMWDGIVLQNDGAAFHRWYKQRAELVEVGLGDDYPEGFAEFLVARCVPEEEFRQAIQFTTEVLYGSLYAAADEVQSRSDLLKLIELTANLSIVCPDLESYRGSLWGSGSDAWGAIPSADALQVWRENVGQTC